MSKASQRKKNRPQHAGNSADGSQKLVTPGYHGNARFIEIGSPGVLFRQLVNIDQITNLRFEERLEKQEDGESIVSGYDVIIAFEANSNSIFFHDADQAIGLYNVLLDQIIAVGAPMTRLPKLELPAEASAIVGADGTPVDATDLHAELAGGEGAGIAENDDGDDFELTDADLELLENPVIDEDAIAAAFEDVDEDKSAN